MVQLNTLTSVNAAPSTASVNAPDSPGGEPGSFAALLENAEESAMLLSERQEQASAPALAQPPQAPTGQTLSSSVLMGLAANDSLETEPQGTPQDGNENSDSVIQLLSELNGTMENAADLPAAALSLNDNLAPLGDIAQNTDIAPQIGIELAAGDQQQVATPLANTAPAPSNSPDGQIQSNTSPVAQPLDNQPISAPINNENADKGNTGLNVEGKAAAPAGELQSAQTQVQPQAPIADINTATAAPQSNPVSVDGKAVAQTETLQGQVNNGNQASQSGNIKAGEDQKAVVVGTGDADAKNLATTPALIKSAVDSAPVKTLQAGTNTTQNAEPSAITRNEGPSTTQSTSQEGSANPGKKQDAPPASLMQRLKPLQQASPLFQVPASAAQDSFNAPDGITPAMTITPTGELARPAGLTGLVPAGNNSGLPQVPLNNIAVHIAAQANAGNQRFNIRLDPPELGRIDIRLEIGRDGQTFTHLAVEKPETLDLLRQDSRQLERALANAGLDSREGGLSFSLREDNQDKRQAGKSEQEDGQPSSDQTIEEDDQTAPVIESTLNVSSGLDISI